jgi:hypothetical protein
MLDWKRDERSHRLHVRLDGALLDPDALLDPSEGADPENRRAQLARSFHYETAIKTNFDERQGWLGHLLSFPIPGAIFPSDRDVLARTLREELGARLLRRFVKDVEFQKGELLAGADLYSFRVVRMALEHDGSAARLHCALELDPTSIDRMDGYRLWIDGELVREGDLTEAGSGRQELDLPLPGLASDSVVRVELRDGAPRQHVRTFTLRPDRTGRRAGREFTLELRPPR